LNSEAKSQAAKAVNITAIDASAVLTRLLGRCLALRHDSADTAQLRDELLGTNQLWPALTKQAAEFGLVMALEASLRARGLLPSGLLPAAVRGLAADRTLVAGAAVLHERRDSLAAHLKGLVGALNAAGIEPLVIKGAQSLLTGEPRWRYLRDIDLVVAGGAAEAAQAALMAKGYRPPQFMPQRSHRHHLAPLVRHDLPGYVEIHRRAGNPYVEALLPTSELLSASERHDADGLRLRLLPAPLGTLYALVHHHVGHSADARGNMSIKGLYEFAWAVDRMTAQERAALAGRAARHPRLVAALDFWIAAAADLFDLPLVAPLAVAPDARARWRRTLARMQEPRPWYKYPGYADEIAMAWRSSRIAACPGGRGLVGRAALRAGVVGSLLPKLRR
jgi:hypothetical protein